MIWGGVCGSLAMSWRHLHQGCKLILAGTSKTNKTWSLLDLGLSAAAGQPWWGMPTSRCHVLYLNFELPDWAVLKRIKAITSARPELQRLDEHFHTWNLRGHSGDFTELRPRLQAHLDEFYRRTLTLVCQKRGLECFFTSFLRACTKQRSRYFIRMTQAVKQILIEAEQLSAAEREELADRLVESLIRDIPPAVERAHLAEVRQRIAQVDSGEVHLVPGDAALEQVRRLVGSSRAGR